MSGQQKLSKDFLLEFFKSSLSSTSILETGRAYLKYSYLPDESHKRVWKTILDHYILTERAPTIGVLAEKLSHHIDCLSILADIKSVGMPNREDILVQLEEYIKNAKFRVAYDDLYETFTKGDRSETYKLLKNYADDLSNFTIRTAYFDSVFSGYQTRVVEREMIATNPTVIENNFKIPFGLPEVDYITRGGISSTDTACFLAQSGVGKSKLLKYIGVHASRLGYRVAHFQLEGSKKECLDLYDAAWTGVVLHALQEGIVSEKQRERIDSQLSDMINGIGGEIFVEAYEQFDTASMVDIRNSLIELEKVHGKIHLVLIDYLEECDPGDGKNYRIDQEKERREAVARKMKNLAVEFNTRVITATQAHGIERKQLNDPEFVMDRYNTSMGKNLLNSFSFFISMNQTEDEKDKKIMRLFLDKLRQYRSKQVVYIAQNYDREQFCDKKRTRELFFKPQV